MPTNLNLITQLERYQFYDHRPITSSRNIKRHQRKPTRMTNWKNNLRKFKIMQKNKNNDLINSSKSTKSQQNKKSQRLKMKQTEK